MTILLQVMKKRMKHFNSHPHEEDDMVQESKILQMNHFNSHPHEEDDMVANYGEVEKNTFQLTSSRRG